MTNFKIQNKFKLNKNLKNKVLSLGIFFLALIWYLSFGLCHFLYASNIKEPNVAGAFYPSDEGELTSLIEKYTKDAQPQKSEGKPLVLISPHAGYIYSGPVAAYGYKALLDQNFETVVILAPSHYFPYQGADVYKEGFFRTPLGDVEIDSDLSSELIKRDPKLLFFDQAYFEKEHSIEVQLPFLQKSLKPGFKIVPVLIGDVTLEECRGLAGYIIDVVKDKNVLVLASTDLSHYRPYEEAISYDTKTISFIKDLDAQGLWNAVAYTGWNVCGSRAVVTSLFYAKMQGADKVQILKMANSADTAGDKARVVGYLSAIIAKAENHSQDKLQVKNGEQNMLTREDKKRLLEIARSSIAANVSGTPLPKFEEKSPGLNIKRGAFVTLNKKGALRGCIGLFSSSSPLYKVVSEMSIESSSHDYRFSPVEAGELKDITIEISVLSEPKLIDNWKNIRLGIDGVIVRNGFSSGVFLPQVATETGWSLEVFLGQLCSQKAGLPSDCFKNPQTKIYTFVADVFSEDQLRD